MVGRLTVVVTAPAISRALARSILMTPVSADVKATATQPVARAAVHVRPPAAHPRFALAAGQLAADAHRVADVDGRPRALRAAAISLRGRRGVSIFLLIFPGLLPEPDRRRAARPPWAKALDAPRLQRRGDLPDGDRDAGGDEPPPGLGPVCPARRGLADEHAQPRRRPFLLSAHRARATCGTAATRPTASVSASRRSSVRDLPGSSSRRSAARPRSQAPPSFTSSAP